MGKSILVTQMLHALATGTSFFGKPEPTPLTSVLIQADTPPAIWQDEMAQVGGLEASPVNILFVEKGCMSGGLEPLIASLEPLRPCYIAFDALDSLFTLHDVNDPKHVFDILSRLKKVAGGDAFTLIHHTRKGSPGETEDLRDAAAGSRVLLNQADHVIYLRSGTGPIEITGRLAFHTYEPRNLKRHPGGRWEYVEPRKP